MKLISHRGNLNGPNKLLENKEEYVQNAINLGFDVEIDVWWHNNQFFLGHDFPQWKLKNISILSNSKSWCHAKNLEAIVELSSVNNCNFFWHQNDDFTLTSKRYIWTYPGKKLTSNSVCVVNEKMILKDQFSEIHCYGICSDYVSTLKNY